MSADLEALRGNLQELQRVLVAFSGGADSVFLAWVANDTLGSRLFDALQRFAESSRKRVRGCASLAQEWGLNWSP
ncbi:MAG: hypothetical protein Ct9H300mP26_5330 [Acidimicrobiales bacterium]|nr:MAG: hypothetical protein Ct9H300mP26_5330 [Acidimicrobiales bacterium]